jgi:hypothetical protein
MDARAFAAFNSLNFLPTYDVQTDQTWRLQNSPVKNFTGLFGRSLSVSLPRGLGTTDYDLRTLCKRLNIPTPASGHWMKLQHNKPVMIIPLPEIVNGTGAIAHNDLNEIIGLTPLEQLKNELKSDPNLCFDVPEKVVNPDALVIAAKSFFEGKNSFKNENIQATPADILSISVSKPVVIRALRLMDTLIKICKKRGHDVYVSDNGTMLTIFGQSMKIALVEETKKITRQDGKWPTHEQEPTGVLSLKVDESWKGKKYSDGKSLIENRLVDIYARIELLCKEMKEREDEWRKSREEQEEKARNEMRSRELQEAELNKFMALLSAAHRHNQIELMKVYIDDVESTLEEKGEERPELEEWIKWARRKLEWYDPSVALDDPLLADIDRDTLKLRKKDGYY